ncbi:MAG: hypothetical protein Ct9H300mP18_04410 [Candidatus Neomarinimicrobiota bacterium]|nr:MAG: hypothetical protein Ct9H300mP18_04410 [Candidatus Neomarinimicrobiota bacterium]
MNSVYYRFNELIILIMKIFIVDNNSSDGSVELFKNNFPDVKLLSLDKNLKYAGGKNAAIDFPLI